jgi:hypothetical protein
VVHRHRRERIRSPFLIQQLGFDMVGDLLRGPFGRRQRDQRRLAQLARGHPAGIPHQRCFDPLTLGVGQVLRQLAHGPGDDPRTATRHVPGLQRGTGLLNPASSAVANTTSRCASAPPVPVALATHAAVDV